VEAREDDASEVRAGRIEVRRSARWFERGAVDAPELWLVLHGYGQLASAFLLACAPLAREGRRLVAPEALSRFYLRSGRGAIGASWMTSEAREQEIEDYVAYLDALVERCGASASRLNVLGFSQGVATAWRWTTRARRTPQRLIACGGGLPPDLDLEAPALRALDVVLSAGERDEAYPPHAAQHDAERLAGRVARCEVALHAGGHELDLEALARL
jgi:predicted esterase